jgi:hypothetical protein
VFRTLDDHMVAGPVQNCRIHSRAVFPDVEAFIIINLNRPMHSANLPFASAVSPFAMEHIADRQDNPWSLGEAEAGRVDTKHLLRYSFGSTIPFCD